LRWRDTLLRRRATKPRPRPENQPEADITYPSGRHRISAPPETGEDLPHSVFTRKKKYRFDFDGDSGRTVYFCLKYENGKGGEAGEGPFGPILSAVIP
jgi:hypothetical protein